MKNRLRELRKQINKNQTQMGKMLGVAQNTISCWENGVVDIDTESLKKLADYFGCTVDYILYREETNLLPLRETLSAGSKIPVLGKVPAGIPIEAVQDIIDEIELSEKLSADSHDYFALLVSGNSMYPEYMDGDIVIVRKQDTAETGDDVVAYVNGNDATLKRLVRSMRGITLRPLNPEFEPRTFTNEEIESIPVRIAGIVVEQRRNRR